MVFLGKLKSGLKNDVYALSSPPVEGPNPDKRAAHVQNQIRFENVSSKRVCRQVVAVVQQHATATCVAAASVRKRFFVACDSRHRSAAPYPNLSLYKVETSRRLDVDRVAQQLVVHFTAGGV